MDFADSLLVRLGSAGKYLFAGSQHWGVHMKKPGIIVSLVFFLFFTSFQLSEAKRKNYYRTFEIIAITGNNLTLQDGDGNVIEINREAGNYKVGYKVRYDSVRKRLRAYRWQDYKVIAISDYSITLQHKTGDTLSVEGNYLNRYEVGDPVRYDSVDKKLQPNEDSGQWKQYTVSAAYSDKIILQANDGEQIILPMDNNLYPERRGVYIGKYETGDLVRYNATTNKLKKGVLRTYDWQDYAVKEVAFGKLILHNEDGEELVLDNIYDLRLEAGEQVKYDRLNNLLKKVR